MAARSARRVATSVPSMVASTCPALTRLPSATASVSNVPPALARTVAVCGATSGPENSIRCAIVTRSGCTTSRGANSSVGSGGLSSFLAPRVTASAAATPAAASRPPPAAHHHALLLRI
jgi:hypothetical protein